MRDAAVECSYAVPPYLTPQRERLIERLLGDWLPPRLTRVHLTASGSEGVETLVKIALEYHAARGCEKKTKIIARTPSYHGTTLGALAMSGHASRRFGLDHALPPMPDVPAPYALRCPDTDVGDYCMRALQERIHREDPQTVAGILAEPIVGASGGALIPPDGYWQLGSGALRRTRHPAAHRRGDVRLRSHRDSIRAGPLGRRTRSDGRRQGPRRWLCANHRRIRH